MEHQEVQADGEQNEDSKLLANSYNHHNTEKRQKEWKIIGSTTQSADREIDDSTKPEQTTLEVSTTAQLEDGLTTNPNFASELEETDTSLGYVKGGKGDDDEERIFPEELRDILDQGHYLANYPKNLTSKQQPFRGGYATVKFLEGIEQCKFDDIVDRIATFARKFQSVSMTGSELAKAGFISASFTTKSPDQVLCVWCGLTLWQFGDHVNALAIHQSHNRRNCSFLQKRSQGVHHFVICIL